MASFQACVFAAAVTMASGCFVQTAFAAEPPSLAGTWSIVNWVTKPRVVLARIPKGGRDHTEYSGVLVVQPAPNGKDYVGTMTVMCTNCTPQTTAREKMAITLAGATVTLKGTVETSSSGRYSPDNLVLTLSGTTFMTGSIADDESVGEISLRRQ